MNELFHGRLTLVPASANVPQPAVAVIMAGGSGTRFWPMSRSDRPKQFLPLGADADSLIQATAKRVLPLVGASGVLVVTASNQSSLVLDQLPEAAVLAEPQARNTAACLGFAAQRVLAEVGDVPMICLPADHVVLGQDKIIEVYRTAIELAASHDVLVTIGITPRVPETGYGYIQRSNSLYEIGPGYVVERFVEKPNRTTAESYLAEGSYFWNSGMFVWRPSVLLKAISEFLPDLSTALEEIAALAGAADEFDQVAEIYSKLKSVSIDVGVMERASNVVMIPGDSFTWSDVGSWSSWSETIAERSADESGNIVQGDVVMLGSSRCTVVSTIVNQGTGAPSADLTISVKKPRLIAAIGLEDLIIVDTPDALLICPKEKSQEVKEIVQLLARAGRNDLL